VRRGISRVVKEIPRFARNDNICAIEKMLKCGDSGGERDDGGGQWIGLPKVGGIKADGGVTDEKVRINNLNGQPNICDLVSRVDRQRPAMRFKGEEEDLFRRCAEEDAARCDAYD